MPKLTQNKLTAAKVRAIKNPGSYADGNGLYVSVVGNSKIWRFMYRFGGKQKAISLGPVRDLTLANARSKVHDLRAMVKDGIDPRSQQESRRTVPTFEKAALSYIEKHEPTWKHPKHKQQWRNTLSTYAYPIIGELRVDQIEAGDVMSVLDTIWLSKPETARRVKQRMEAVMHWTIAKGYRASGNPVTSIHAVMPRQKDKVEHHAAMPYHEIPNFLKKLRCSVFTPSARLGLEWLIFTAVRTSEAMGARWDEIDDDIWTIPTQRMKAGKEHRVPLSPRCLEILESIPRFDNSPFIFPGRSWTKPLSNMAFAMCLRRLGCDNITVHGFRSSFRDWTIEQTSAPHEVCEAALAHDVKNKVEAAYRRSDLFEKRRALMDQWGRFLTEERGKVVPLKAGKEV